MALGHMRGSMGEVEVDDVRAFGALVHKRERGGRWSYLVREGLHEKREKGVSASMHLFMQ